MQLIALGRAVAVAPASVRGHLRNDLACVPVTDAQPTTLVLAWSQGTPSIPTRRIRPNRDYGSGEPPLPLQSIGPERHRATR